MTADQVAEFRRQMRYLIKAQLSIERVGGELQAQHDVLGNEKAQSCTIDEVGKYIHDIVKEWEITGKKIIEGADAATCVLSSSSKRSSKPETVTSRIRPRNR